MDDENPSNQPVLTSKNDGIATITLNRPDSLNSLTVAAKEGLLAALTDVATDDAVRCVVLTGSGRAFCVGQDLKEHVKTLQEEGPGELFNTVEEHYNPIVSAIATMAKPVVAAVNGVAAGAGASLAFACDLRICSEAAGFNLAFSAIALSCDTGSSWTLPRLVGPAKAIELMYFPRTVPAEEALALGLATRVVAADDLAAEVADVARRLADGADRVVRRDPALRRLLGRSRLHRQPGPRVVDDDAHRRYRGPPRCRRRVPREAAAGVPGPMTD